MRLIDADIADVVIIYDRSNELMQVSAVREYTKRQKAFLDKFPTIDAVPVVRCRECKHARIHPCGYVYCHRDGRNAYEMTFNIDGFCSYGERKEGAD